MTAMQRTLFDIVCHGASRLYDEVNQILEFAYKPHQAGPYTSVSFGEIQAIITQIGQELELSSLTVTMAQPLLNEARIPLTKQSTELILREILHNAQKFHPERSPTIEIGLAVSSNQVTLTIADDGLTLSPEQLAKIWTPYYQGEKNFTGEVPGMGLGLAHIASIVWSIGGTCHLYNRKAGAGVVIELLLPLTHPE